MSRLCSGRSDLALIAFYPFALSTKVPAISALLVLEKKKRKTEVNNMVQNQPTGAVKIKVVSM